jgi:predicted nucleotidyltransferase
MAKVPNQIINSVRRFKESIKSGLDVKKIILLGSYASGNYTENSDIDVCVIAENISNSYLAMLQIAPKVVDIDVRIEPVVFSEKEFNEPISYGLLKEVKEYGIEV